MEELHELLTKKGIDNQPFEVFKNTFSGDVEAQRGLHAVMVKRGIDNQPFEVFQGTFFGGAEPPKKKVDGSGVSSVGVGTASPAIPTPENAVPVETADDDIAGVLAQPTGQSAYNWITNAVKKSGVTTWEPTPEDMAIGEAAIPHLEALAKRKDLSPEQKYLDAKRMLTNAAGGTSGGKDLQRILQNDIARSEETIERANPEAYKQVLKARLDDAFEASSMKSRQSWENMRLSSSLSDAFGDDDMGQMAKQEADLRMARDIIAARDFEYAKGDPQATAELTRKRDSELSQLDSQINELRNVRLANVDGQIEELEKSIAGTGGTPEEKAALKTLIQNRSHFLDPNKAKAQVEGMFKEEIAAQPGKTPREKMRNLYLAYDQQIRELEPYALGESTGEALVNQGLAATIGGTDDVTRRYNTLLQRRRALAPAVFFNQGPTDQSTGEAFMQSAKDMFGGVKTTAGASDASVAADIQESLMAAGVNPDDLNPEVVKDLNKRAEGYGLLDPRFYAEMGGTVSGLIAQSLAGGAATKGLSAPKWAAGSKVLSTLFGMAKQGAAYEISGQVFKDSQDELDFVSGMFGGAVESAMGAGVLKKMAKNVFGTFGDKAPQALEIIKKAGSGAVGESFEETLQDLWHVYRDTGSFQDFVKGHDTWSENLKYYFGVMLMGGGMGAGTAFGQGADAEAARVYAQLTPEEKVIADEQVQQTTKAVQEGVTEASTAPQAEAIETAQSFEVGKGGELEAAPDKRLANKEEMLAFAKDQQEFPEAYSKGDPLTKFRLRQDMGVVGQPDPVNTLKEGAEMPIVEQATEAVAVAPVPKEVQTEVAAATEAIAKDDFTGVEDALADIDLDDEAAVTEALGRMVADPPVEEVGVEAPPMDVSTAATVVDSKEAEPAQKEAAVEVLAQEGMESDGKGNAVPMENPAPEVVVKQQVEAKEEVAATKKIAKPAKGAKTVGESGSFEERTSSGRTTEWKKEGDKWQFRNKAPKGSTAKYTADWQDASPADAKRIEEVAGMTQQQLDVRNAMADVGSKWKAMGRLGGLSTGADPRKVLDFLESVTNLGVALMKSGVVDAAEWTKAVKGVLDEKGITIDKLLPKLYDKSKKRFDSATPKAESKPVENKAEPTVESTKDLPKDTEKPVSRESGTVESTESLPKGESKPESKEGEEKKEAKPRIAADILSTTGETRQRGLEQTLLKHGETFGEFLTDLVKETPNLYEKIDFEEVMAVAKNRIEEEGLAAVHRELTKRGNIDPVVSAMQGLAMQMYSKMGENAVKAGDMELAAKLNDALDEIIVTAGADATQRGQANGIIGQFGFIAPYMDTYVKGRYDKLMDKIMKAKDGKGRTLKEKTSAAAKDINKAKKEKAEQIADSVTSTKAVTEAKADPKRQTVKANIAAAKAELSQALRAASSAKSGIPLGDALDVTIAATKLGYWTILDGAYKISDFMKKMKAAGLQDEDLINDLWENAEFNGTKLSDLAVEEMKRASAETVTKGVGAEKKTPSESSKAKAEYTKAIRDAIAGHLVNPDGRTLENVLIEDLAMSTEDAVKVKSAVEDKTIEMIGGSIERAANSIQNGVARKQSKEVKAAEKAALSEAKKTVAGRLAMALVDGDLTAESVAGKMAEQLGLPTELTPEMKADLRNKAMAIRETKEGSKVRHAAEWAFAKSASDAIKHINKKGFLAKVADGYKVFISLVYAGMLNGLPTHMKNFLSVMPSILTLGLSGTLNVTKWARAAKRAADYKGPLSKQQVFFYNSPAYEFFFRWKHGNKSFKQAGLEAIDVLRTGKGEYRWEDEVKKSKEAFEQIVQSLPVLERTRFLAGKFNPYNHIFGKLVGRALSTTDALTSLYYENQEVAFALVGAGIDAGMTMKEIDTKMKQFFTKNSPKWQESLTEAQEEAEIASRFGLDIKESTVKAEAARLMREKVKDEFAISKERGQALRAVAKDRIFAYKRHGILGQIADILGGIANLGGKKYPMFDVGLKELFRAIVPFTNIVGNMGDAILDTLPIYGIARANGWGATAIAARLYNKTWHLPPDSKTSFMGKERSFNDDLYVQQLSRAVAGNLAVMALFMIAGDDDDDFLHFTGEVPGKPGDSYKVMSYKKKLFDYRTLTPELFMSIRFVQAAKEYLKQPQNKGEYGWALATASLASIWSIKDMSFLDGVSTFIENSTRAVQSMEQAAGNAEKIGKAASGITKGLLGQNINFLLKPWPGNQAIVKNFEKVISPEQETSGTFNERMWYLLGLQSVMGNEKKIDIAGNVVKSYPGNDIFPFDAWTGLDDEDKAVNKVVTDQKIKNTWPANEIRTFNEPDPESGSPYTQRMLTPAEYTKVSIRAGELFVEKVTAYLTGDSEGRKYDTDKDVVYKETSGGDMARAKKILNGFRGFAWGAAMKELYGEQTLTQTEFNALIGQEGL